MTRRGFLVPVLATAALGACAPLSLQEGLGLGPSGWTEARLTYGPDGHQTLYVRRPKAFASPRPAVLILGPAAPTKAEEAFAAEIADQGMVALVAGRRPSPVSAYPAYISDAAKAVAWCVDHARELGVAPDRIGILGLEEGGLHARMLAADGRYLEAVGLKGRPGPVAVLGAVALPDGTLTHPLAYGHDSSALSIWQGEAGQILQAIQHLKQELNRGLST